MSEQIVKVQPQTVSALREWLEKSTTSIAEVLPRAMRPERMIKLIIVSASRNPKLLECTRESILLALMNCSELGLEPNSPLGLAYVIPYYNGKTKRMEAQFQLGYKGLLALIRRSGEVASVEANVVYQRDKFSIRLGDDAAIHHEPTIEGDRGEVVGAYMVARIKGGQVEREWMTRAEIDSIRDRSQAVKAAAKFGFSTPWDTDYGEMARKTVLKRGGKRLPISIEVAELIEQDNAREFGAGFAMPTVAMPRAVGEPAPVVEAEPADGAAGERSIEDELLELAEVMGKERKEAAKTIAAMRAAGKLEALRDNWRAEYRGEREPGQEG